ncbi:sorbosone dehydrogenase family protein [Massilia terrae]|uniref:Sorbosone dehydrogenase family protein n=1 Tax=Massilia terrae TaxID=1811224 RepID=A0ABT2D2K7_9BURK|nr:sorbosone dehydrogenase family protein [Massilia terrae]MCS0660495.1 sorbosone dehydrogenase family protein [Massilia terrae]
MMAGAALAAALLGVGAAALAQNMPPGYGPNPSFPPPQKSLIPTLHIAPAEAWPKNTHPVPAAGLAVSLYANGLAHPRNVYVLPNGDVLVAETDRPASAVEKKSVRNMVQKHEQKEAGSDTPSANRITLLRGLKADGSAEMKSVLLEGLNSPYGMVLAGDTLYVADADALLSFPYKTGATRITAQGKEVLALPAGINHHWTKNVVASADGKQLYVSVGSNSNAADNGMEIEFQRAAIWEFDIASGKGRVFAGGLRNPNGLAINPQTHVLWTSVNERDELGNDTPPDYLTSVKEGGFYGWPYSYWGQHVDTRVKPQRPDLVAKAIVPDYGLGAHTASLGLVFYDAGLMPQFKDGALIGQHGSWNRKPFAGYKVIFVPFADGKPSGPPQDVLTGFISKDGHAYGRPVGVAVDKEGAIVVADDVGNCVWRITPAGKK